MPRDRYAVCRVKFHPWDISTNGFCSSLHLNDWKKRLQLGWRVIEPLDRCCHHFEGCFFLTILRQKPILIGSMDVIFTYIWLIFMVNVGKYPSPMDTMGSIRCVFFSVLLGCSISIGRACPFKHRTAARPSDDPSTLKESGILRDSAECGQLVWNSGWSEMWAAENRWRSHSCILGVAHLCLERWKIRSLNMFHVILVVTDTGGPHQGNYIQLVYLLDMCNEYSHGLGKPLLKEHKMITRAEQWVSSQVAG